MQTSVGCVAEAQLYKLAVANCLQFVCFLLVVVYKDAKTFITQPTTRALYAATPPSRMFFVFCIASGAKKLAVKNVAVAKYVFRAYKNRSQPRPQISVNLREIFTILYTLQGKSDENGGQGPRHGRASQYRLSSPLCDKT